ncbi:amphi-Trp domain-containing protein [Nocardia jiangxiensis]|uniref:Amphi-Trp domain-containing protein n=1 Tax=Nocardia jiangxiensis TaxID=282685 RepID=A0ABW6SBE9_9NOCA|nr:amphi-Trp domain-containing protein [Nocardia jiangxiensis]
MSKHRKIYQDHRTLTRAELADELRRLAGDLEAGGELGYAGMGGAVSVPPQVIRELEIERSKDDTGWKVEVEFAWADRQSALETIAAQPDHSAQRQ